jgi:signal transduction histidine kinase/CheY-like chemotaxis protein
MEQRILILAPYGRDARVIEHVLAAAGLDCLTSSNAESFVKALEEGAALAMVAEEALDAIALGALAGWLESQPVWSDFPFVVLTSKTRIASPPAWTRIVDTLGNVVLVERPVSTETLISTARSALRARRRQYQARGILADRAEVAEHLRLADRRKDEFLAMLAHELRNPLAPIRNAAETIRLHQHTDSKLRWAGDLIERQSRHLGGLLEDLLDVSRITSGKVTLKRSVVDVADLVRRAIDVAQGALRVRRHGIDVDLPDRPVFVDGDPNRLAQIFGNILDNAIKYTPTGGAIQVACKIDDGTAVISVTDNGVGMVSDDLPLIFDLFSQSDRALDRAQGGLGIGLSVVKTLVTMHGGTISAQSDGLDCGSTFTVSLPVTEAPVPVADTPMVPTAVTGSIDVLVVDDNLDSAESVAMLLEMQGHRVFTAFDGPTALALCKAHRPKVVLLDIGLPGMDGYEVARRLRQIPGMAAATLIAITGYGQPEDKTRSIDAGFDHHLVKPVEPDALMMLVQASSSA